MCLFISCVQKQRLCVILFVAGSRRTRTPPSLLRCSPEQFERTWVLSIFRVTRVLCTVVLILTVGILLIKTNVNFYISFFGVTLVTADSLLESSPKVFTHWKYWAPNFGFQLLYLSIKFVKTNRTCGTRACWRTDKNCSKSSYSSWLDASFNAHKAVRLPNWLEPITAVFGSYRYRAHLFANWEETHAKPHLRFVSMNLRAFVHCSSELNWILPRK